jgi:hypothetical protein
MVTIREEEIRGIFRGLGPTLAREAPGVYYFNILIVLLFLLFYYCLLLVFNCFFI